MRAGVLAAILLAVLVASALNLALGGLWVAAFLVLRLRGRATAWLVLVLALVAAAGAAQLGWLRRPPARPYALDELAWVAERLGRLAPVGPSASAIRAAEPGESESQLERRATAAIAASRQLVGVRERAPAEVEALDEAARRLALALTAPDARLRQQSRAELARAETALAAAVRALSGATVAMEAGVSLEYDEAVGAWDAETRYVVTAGAPLRLTHVRAHPVESDARPLVVTERARWLASVLPVRPALRPVTFARLALGDQASESPELPVTVSLGGTGPELVLLLRSASPRLERIAVPRHALHHATRPGSVRPEGGVDVWQPDPPADGEGVAVELLPTTRLLRNAAFTRVKDYLYTPNLTTALAGVALAALAAGLTGRRRRPAPLPAV